MLMNSEARKRWEQYAKEHIHIDAGTRWKQFYELNKDELDADYKKIGDRRKEKAREYYHKHNAEVKARLNPEKEKERHARYYEKHKDDINEKRREYKKAYYEEHKDRINTDRNTIFECACGGKYTKRHQTTHWKSKKHIKWLDNFEISGKSE